METKKTDFWQGCPATPKGVVSNHFPPSCARGAFPLLMSRAYFINLIGDSGMNTLFDLPHSRTSDPLSSYVAGDRHHLSGKAESHRQQILEFMRGKRPMTSKQIALEMGMDRHEVARRLPEMARKGLVMRQDRKGEETVWMV